MGITAPFPPISAIENAVVPAMIIAQLGSATERSPHRYEEEILAFKDILLALTSYPEPPPLSVVDDAVSIAAVFGAHLTALSCETHVEVPGHFLSGSFAGIPGIIAGEGAKSRQNAQDLLAAFEKAAKKAEVPYETILQKCSSTELPDLLVDYARLRDLTLVSVPEAYDHTYAEVLIFGSGKPTLVLPKTPRSRPFELATVAVAWDFSRAAARAISDALPLLEKARKVRVVTIVDEKNIDSKHSAEELAKNLARHGIDIVLDQEPVIEPAASDPFFALTTNSSAFPPIYSYFCFEVILEMSSLTLPVPRRPIQ